ncbi:MAG: ABC transporter ATP-binding protein [Sulfuricurvum sp.]
MSIVIKNLCKSYGDNLILDHLSLEIKEGSIFGLLGPNGAGKTTLISILNTLTKKDRGEVYIDGLSIDLNIDQIKAISSYVPQEYAFYPNLSVYENLEFFALLYGIKRENLKDTIIEVASFCSLERYLNKRALHFSGGVKRRLNIAIGLLNSPKILYLDEPTVGIDPHSRRYILDVIKKINRDLNTTIIYTSHYMDELEYICDNFAILDDKKIIYQADIKTLKDSHNKKSLEEMFLEITKKSLRD